MAGTRTEKLGTVFTRVQGLLRSGALKEVDKPVWYDVMAAFPPRIEPTYNRLIDNRKTTDVVYREDIIRAKFYNTFGNPAPVDMNDLENLPVSELFIAKFQEVIRESAVENADDDYEEKLIDVVVKKLKEENGIILKSLAQIQEDKEKARAKAIEERKARELEAMKAKTSMGELFGGGEQAGEEEAVESEVNVDPFAEDPDKS